MNSEAYRYSEITYLLAKRSVDDRALNGRVLGTVEAAIRALPRPPRVLELGAGVGTMAARLAARGSLAAARYTLLDSDGASLRAAREHLDPWARRGLDVELVEADVFAWLDTPQEAPYDLVIASAFLDLVDVPALLPKLWRRVGPGRPFWFSINFDGETILLPELDGDTDVMRRYHRSMDDRVRNGRRAGESRTGRHLLESLPRSGARIVEAGSSDWVVWPTDGAYPAEEAVFLHHIVATIEGALDGAFSDWVAARHAQVERGELIYIAHQLDVAGYAP